MMKSRKHLNSAEVAILPLGRAISRAAPASPTRITKLVPKVHLGTKYPAKLISATFTRWGGPPRPPSKNLPHLSPGGTSFQPVLK